MKKKMNINEFCTYCNDTEPSAITFWSDNQINFVGRCIMRMVFERMEVNQDGRSIYLFHKNGGVVKFESVQHVLVTQNDCSKKVSFGISCEEDAEKKNYLYVVDAII